MAGIREREKRPQFRRFARRRQQRAAYNARMTLLADLPRTARQRTPRTPRSRRAAGADVGDLDRLLVRIRACRVCAAHLPLGPCPVVQAGVDARLLIVGQAPGAKVHASGVPWDDASGVRLREWLGVDASTFHDASQVAIAPIGFCYPGRGGGGDLPPRPECAPLWFDALLARLPNIELALLIGQYAQRRFL